MPIEPEIPPGNLKQNEEIDLLNFDLPQQLDNKENKTPVGITKEDEYDILNMDLLGNDISDVQNPPGTGEILDLNVDLTPLPLPVGPKKKKTLDDIDEFALFDNLKG